MIIEFSFDDGNRLDLKVAKLLNKYGFGGTFYIPSNCEMSEDEIKLIANDHTIGGHTVNHMQDLKLLTDNELKIEIEDNRKWLQKLTGQGLLFFCYPRGRYDERVIRAVMTAGYSIARTTKVLETDTPPKDFEYGTTIHMYNRNEYNGTAWYDIARSMFDVAKKKRGYYHLWGHSWEIDKNNDWDNFENLLDYINKNI